MGYEDLIAEVSSRYDIDPELAERLVDVESGGNPDALGASGEVGLTQILPSTAADMAAGRSYSLSDPATNLDLGLGYYAKMRDEFKDPTLALYGYNAGPGRLREAQQKAKDLGLDPQDPASVVGFLPTSTAEYAKKVSGDVSPSSSTLPLALPTLDTSTGGAGHEISSKTSSRENYLRRLTDNLDDARRDYAEAMAKANQEDSPDINQAIAAIFTAAIPTLVGAAMGGRRGALVGLEAGAAGGSILAKDMAIQGERKRERARAEALMAKEDLKTTQNQYSQLLRDEFISSDKDARAGAHNKAIIEAGKQPQQMDTALVKEVTGLASMSVLGDRVLSGIEGKMKQHPELKAQNLNPDGSIKWEGLKETLSQSAADALFGAGTPRGDVINDLRSFAKIYNHALSGAAATDTEFERAYAMLTGEGLLPQDIPTIIATMRKASENLKLAATLKHQLYSTLGTQSATPEQFQSVLDKFFTQSNIDPDRGSVISRIALNFSEGAPGSSNSSLPPPTKIDVSSAIKDGQVDVAALVAQRLKERGLKVKE